MYSLTTPMLLGGLAFLCLPLLAHLVQKNRARRLVFPSNELARQTVIRHTGVMQVQRRWLLLLRLLAVAAIVFAFTQPLWLTAAADQQSGRTVIVLLDASASTQQLSGGSSTFSQLKKEVIRLLSELRSGTDEVAVILVSDIATALQEQMQTRPATVAQAVEAVAPSVGTANWDAALPIAKRLMESARRRPELFVFSDWSRSNWITTAGVNYWKNLSSLGERCTPVGVSTPVEPNTSLGRVYCAPEHPLPGEAFRVVFEVTNHSELTIQVSAEASYGLNDVQRPRTTIMLGPRAEREVALNLTFAEQPIHEVAIRLLEPDSLLLDNTTTLIVQPRPRSSVLLISDEAGQTENSSAFYLTRALAPRGSTADPFRLTVRKAEKVTPADWNHNPVVIVDRVSFLSAELQTQVAEHLERGGSLWWLNDSAGAGELASQLETAVGEPVLPWQPVPPELLPFDKPAHWIGGKWDSAWLRVFDETSQLALERLSLTRLQRPGGLRPLSEVLLTATGGTPALAWRTTSHGARVLQAAFSFSGDSSDLGQFGLFVALAQRLVAELAGEPVRLPATYPGNPLTFAYEIEGATAEPPTPEPLVMAQAITQSAPTEPITSRGGPAQARQYSVVGPDGTPQLLGWQTVGGQFRPMVLQTSQLGVYRLKQQNQFLAGASVALNPTESQLDRLTPEEFAALTTPSAQNNPLVQTGQIQRYLPENTIPLWGVCLWMAAFCIASELGLLAWWGR